MNQPKKNWESQVDSIQKHLVELAEKKEMLVLRVKKAYMTLDQIKGESEIRN
jgi:hypothetical protein